MRFHAKKFHVALTALTRVYGTLCGRTVDALRIGFRSRETPNGHPVTCRACLKTQTKMKARA